MNNIKLIHVGDIHLGLKFKNTKFSSDLSMQRKNEIWETFESVIDRCNENLVDILLIAGDMFEEDYFTISDMKRIESKLRTLTNTRVVIIAGNHDPINNSSLHKLIEWPQNVYMIEENTLTKIEFNDINTVVWGISWDKKEEKRNLLENINELDNQKINILLAHGDTYDKNSNYMPIDIEEVRKNKFNYVALGHIHKHEFIDDNIAYCGSLEPLDFGETGKHGVIEGEISLEKTNMTFTPFSKREFIKREVTINENMTYHNIIEDIIYGETDEDRFKNFYRVNIKGVRDKEISIGDDMKEIIKSKFTHIDIIDDTIPDYDIEKIYEENQNNIIGHFIAEIKNKDLEDKVVKRALYLGLEALLSEKVIS